MVSKPSEQPLPLAAASGRSFSAARQLRALLEAELKSQWRGRETPATVVVFALLVVLIFSFAFDLHPNPPADVVSGVVWSAIIFGGILAFQRSFGSGADHSQMDGILVSPVSRSVLLVAKMVANAALMIMMECIVVPVAALLFNVPLWRPSIVASVLVGTAGFSVLGTLFAAISVEARARELLLPLLLLPISVPLIIASVEQMSQSLAPSPPVTSEPWFQLALGYSVMFFFVSVAVADQIFDA